MAKKYYAVRKGKQIGIFATWDDCKMQVEGYSGAEYKSFKTQEEAENYLQCKNVGNTETIEEQPLVDAVEIYVDGSYCSETNAFSYGMIILQGTEEFRFSEKIDNSELAQMHNVAGEIKGAEAAMKYAVDHGIKKIIIYHDYEGIAKWCTGEWKATKSGTQAYKNLYNQIKEKVNIEFVKVAGHSNNKYNDIADELAKAALGIGKTTEHRVNKEQQVAKSVYITRNLDKLEKMLNEIAVSLWTDVEHNGICDSGNHKRYMFSVEGREALLDIYQRTDGQTTLSPTGGNLELSQRLKEEIELRGYRTTADQKSFSMFVGEEWIERTLSFLGDFCNGEYDKKEEGSSTRYTFVSEIGDRLTLTVYSNHRVLVQGKPLLLYNEFISFVSCSPKVEMNDIIKATNTFVSTDTDVDAARGKMAEMMPVAYSGSVNDTIWKVFSPAVALMDVDKVLEDYSCCVFPALRALEGYLQFLLDEKGIVIDKKHNFSTVFEKDSTDETKFVVIQKHVNNIANAQYVQGLEEVYNYFNKNRHVIFHMNQIFIDTKVIESKEEAITTVSEVAELIERTYKNVF